MLLYKVQNPVAIVPVSFSHGKHLDEDLNGGEDINLTSSVHAFRNVHRSRAIKEKDGRVHLLSLEASHISTGSTMNAIMSPVSPAKAKTSAKFLTPAK